jgi:single-stranded DNA-binding protein
MIEALITGKLHQRAEERTSKGGRPFVKAQMRTTAGEAEGLFVNVVAFSESACAALLALDAGDSLALAGTLKPGAWIDRDGNARPGLDLVAAQVLTLYGLKRRRAAAAGEPEPQERPAQARQGTQQPHQQRQHDPEDFGPQHWPEDR